MCEVAALLHDIGKSKGRKDHHSTGRSLAEEFLKSVDLPEEKKALILKCIFYHRSRFSEDYEVEVKVIQSADCLGALFNDGWQEHCRETIPKDVLRKFYEEGALQEMALESARKIAQPQLRILLERLT